MFLVRAVKLGRGVTVLSRDKTEVLRVGGRRSWMQEEMVKWPPDFIERLKAPA